MSANQTVDADENSSANPGLGHGGRGADAAEGKNARGVHRGGEDASVLVLEESLSECKMVTGTSISY